MKNLTASFINVAKVTSPSNLLRVFTTLSLILLVVILFLNGYVIHRIHKIHTFNDVEHATRSISRFFFEQKKEILFHMNSEGQKSLNVEPGHVVELEEYLLKYMAPLDILKIKIFSKNKRIVYSTDHSIIGQIDADNEALKRALKGEVVSKLEKKDMIWDIAGEEQFNVDIAETYIPVRDNNVIIGAFEIYTDTTRSKGEISSVLKSSLVVFAVVMILSLSLLFILMRRGTVQLRKNEELLRESEESFRSVAETANDAIISIGDDGKIIFWNHAAEKIFGHTGDEAVGRNIIFIMPHRFHKDHQKGLERFLKTGQPKVIGKTVELLGLRKGDREFPLELTISNWEMKDKTVFTAIIRDITDRKKAEKEKEKLETQLLQSQKMESIGTLAGGIAHDFNNILTSIIGYTELALTDVEKGSLVEENLQEVRKGGNRARDLVKQILTFARQGEKRLSPIRVSLIAKEALKLIRSSIPASIQIEQNIVSDSSIVGDTTRIHQILMNLCTNAAQAMEDDGGVLRVSLTDVNFDADFSGTQITLKPGNYLELTVSDTGTGISPDTIPSIFEPYYTTKAPGQGTGMGLAMVHGIVQSHGGEIAVESEMGKGTVFRIYLPVTKKDAESIEYKTEDLPTGSERILFVDDELPIAEMGSQMLERLGYTVTMRTSSIEALALFRNKPDRFDLVITDMTMPHMTGDKFALELMKIRSDIPVILCTGYSKKISDEQAAEIGIKAYTMKPLVMRDLATMVRKVLNQGIDDC